MAYDEELASRIRELIPGSPDVVEKKMFGGLAFMIGGRMAIAASGGGGILIPVDPEQSEQLIQEPGVSRMVMRGREMAGWLNVDAEVVTSSEQVAGWVELALRGCS
ncbi:MAG TPA: TfoX/Sxy family protein [Solirubrobacteraceae bacterium]|nr:TfoX/Sxy family protein [Solirubrobacteraceae bacterium]